MAIVANEFIKYDTEEHFYYLSELGMTTYVMDGERILSMWNDGAKRLKIQGRQLHLKQIKSRYNSKQVRYRHRDLIEYKIFLNVYDEVQAITNSLVAMVEITEDTGWDRDLFAGKVEWPEAVLDPIHEAKILVYGEICGQVPEDEYRVDY